MNKRFEIQNKKVRFEYEIIQSFNAGIQLIGSEIKSIRNGKISINDSFCFFKNGELFVTNMVITESKNSLVHEPNRIKKLLLKKTELNKLQNQLVKGMSILVTKVFLNDKGMAKVEIVLGKGKKLYDKRETIKERDLNRKNNFVD